MDEEDNDHQGEDVDGFVEDAKAKLEEIGDRMKASAGTDVLIAGLIFTVPLFLLARRKR